MPTQMNEKSFEDLLVAHLVEQNGYEAGTSKDYAPEYGFDPTRLEAFLRSTQPAPYTHLRDHETPEHLVCRLLPEKKTQSCLP